MTEDRSPEVAALIRTSLSGCKLFHGLSQQQLDEVARHGELLVCGPGQELARQGERADAFFIVVAGKMSVEMSVPNQEHAFQLSTLGVSDFFGEMSTLLGSERNATVKAEVAGGQVLKYSGAQFQNMLKNLPYFSAALAHSLAYRLRDTSVRSSSQQALSELTIDASVLHLLPEIFCVRQRVFPLEVSDGHLLVGVVDEPTPSLLTKLQAFVPSLKIHVQSISPHQFDDLMRSSIWPQIGQTPEQASEFQIEPLLAKCIAEGASDLHLASGIKPRWRVDGALVPIVGCAPLSSAALDRVIDEILPHGLSRSSGQVDLDFAYEFRGGERFRVNVYRDLNGSALALRHIPSRILTLDQLGAPKVLKKVCEKPKGLFLVTGPTGSGKSTTLAAMIHLINETQKRHIITLEDPIEYRHVSALSLVNQREVGVHTKSFASALRSALREDPDVVLVGEMRDLETIALAIEVAQTGHLVFATLHTNSAIGTIERIVGMFDSERQAQIRDSLSDVLVGVVSQTLLKRKHGGRVGAYEVMLLSPAIANLIRERKTPQIESYLSTMKEQGNQTLDSDLTRLVNTGLVDLEEARRKSLNPERVGR